MVYWRRHLSLVGSLSPLVLRELIFSELRMLILGLIELFVNEWLWVLNDGVLIMINVKGGVICLDRVGFHK